MPDILVATPIEETWGKKERIIFLGEWCKIYTRKDFLKKRDYITLNYHWSDKDKMDRDKINIENLYEKKLKILANKLNEIHEINKSDKYWRIIIGPWLATYIAVIYERWEVIKSFVESDLYSEEMLFYTLRKHKKNVFNFTTESLREKFYQDTWNQKIFTEIIKLKHLNKLKIVEKDYNIDKYYRNQDWKLYEDSKIKYYLKSILKFLNIKFGKFIINQNKILFDERFMSIPKFLQLNFSMNCYPCSVKNFFIKSEIELIKLKKFNTNIREKLNLESTNQFEKFLDKKIIEDLPLVFLEKFSFAREVVKKYISPKKKLIFSNVNIYFNDLYKIWVAEMCSAKSKLLITAHGDFIPYKYIHFDHERKIADKYITWHKTSHEKEIQMSPLKLIGKSEKFSSNKNNLLIVGLEVARYTSRMQSLPVGAELIKSFEKLISLTTQLDKNILDFTKLRIGNNFEQFLLKRFSDRFGDQKISKQTESLYDEFKCSRLTLHTYPSTPFLESINLNLPSILFFDRKSWGLRSDFSGIVDDLMQKKIIFENENEAAKHINLIWSSVDKWWYSDNIQKERKKILKNFCNIKKNWIHEYKEFFNQIYNDFNQ